MDAPLQAAELLQQGGVTAWRPASSGTPDMMVGVESPRPLSLWLMTITPTAASPLKFCKT